GTSLHLMTSGVLLDKLAERVARHFTRVCVSLDAATRALYEDIRGVDALGAVGRGIERLRRAAPHVPVALRSTLHRANFRELPRLIDHARTIGAEGVSFLPADLSSTAFGRTSTRTPIPTPTPNLMLSAAEVAEFSDIVERTIAVYRHDFESGFVA